MKIKLLSFIFIICLGKLHFANASDSTRYSLSVSHSVSLVEWTTLVNGLKLHEKENVDSTSSKYIRADYKVTATSDPAANPIMLLGELRHHTLYIPVEMNQNLLNHLDIFKAFLECLPSKIKAHNTVIFCNPSEATLNPLLLECLKAQGFELGSKIAKDGEAYEERPYAYYKITPSSPVAVSEGITFGFSDKDEKAPSLPPYPQIGIFLRNEKEEIVGGICARIHEDSSEAFAQKFWVDSALRGKGYGREILDLLERTLRERGVKTITLETQDYQAPDFYRRRGYTEIGRLPEMVKLKDGTYSKFYSFWKRLGDDLIL